MTKGRMWTMERLRDDPRPNLADSIFPDWHLDILCEREERLKRGKERVLEWEQAKKEIEESLP